MTDKLVECICHRQDAVSAAAAATFVGDINAPSTVTTDTPLSAAVTHSKVETVRALGRRGDINPLQVLKVLRCLRAVPRRGYACFTAVHMAETLFDAFPQLDVSSFDARVHEPLRNAIQSGDEPLLSLLLNKGATLERVHFPLVHLAPNIVNVLSKHGASERSAWMRVCVLAATSGITFTDDAAVSLPRTCCALVDVRNVAAVEDEHHLVGEYALTIALFLQSRSIPHARLSQDIIDVIGPQF